jgi:predicted GH43/DUF377 family glycosyl hydrolase
MLFTGATNLWQGGQMVLGHAVSSDGVSFECDTEPFIRPSPNANDFDHASAEDCRITEIDGKYYITYAAVSFNVARFAKGERRVGPNDNRNPTWTENFRRVGLAVTEDWKSVERLGPITSEHLSDANVVLFPEKVDSKYVLLHRPTGFIPWTLPLIYSPASIWITFSGSITCRPSDRREMPWDMKDKIDIPDDHLLITPEYEWERLKVGAAGVPIPTDDGFLVFYHAVDRAGIYRVGLMLLDRDDPRKIIARSSKPIMQPEAIYETDGSYPGCIVPCANVVMDDDVFMYYGAADLYCCLATMKLNSALDYLLQSRKKTVF